MGATRARTHRVELASSRCPPFLRMVVGIKEKK